MSFYSTASANLSAYLWRLAAITAGIFSLGASEFGSNSSNVTIPDNGGWVSSTITISGAPAGSTVTSIDVHFGIIHTYSGDLNVDLNADSQGDLGNYDLWEREGGGSDNPSRTVNGITTFNGLSVNRTWYLYAHDEAPGDTGYIDEWWIRVYYDSVSPPGSFTLSNDPPVCDTDPPGPSPAVRLNWTASNGATSYDLYRNGSLYASGISGTTYYNSAGLTPGQTYTYFVRARNSAGSRDSNTISVFIPSDICVSPPGSFTLSNDPPVCDTDPPGPSPAVRLNWTASNGATSYDLYRNGSFYDSGISGTTYYNSAGLTPGQTYTYFVRARNSAGSRDSNTISVFIPSDICVSPPGSFTLSNDPPVCDTNSPGPSPAVRLNWTTSSNATSYDVYRNGSFYTGGHTGNTFYNSENVVAGQTYTYFIRARNSSGSTDSNEITVIIPSDICAPDIRIEPLTLNFDSQATHPIRTDKERDRILLKRRQFIPDVTSASTFEAYPTPRHLILQFTDEPHAEILELLADVGVQILHRVPRNAVVARVPSNTDLSMVAGIRWIGTLRPDDKVSSRIEGTIIDGFAVVDFFTDVNEGQALAIIEAAGGWRIPNSFLQPSSYLVVSGIDVVRALSLFDEVSWIRPASVAEIAGDEVFNCPGGLAPLGNLPNFVLHDDGWDGPGQGTAHDLLFQFDNGTADISGSLEEPEVARAFNEWAKHAAVTYTETTIGSLNRSMDISWATGDHGDGVPFDGTGGFLAHNFFPSPPVSETIAGDMHFDDDETWRIGAGTGYDVFTVALHEAGHGLGLAHSDDPAAVMFPSIPSTTIFTELNADDIAGIQTIYAPASGSESFTVFNDGPGTLDVISISLDSPASWISWSPAAFTVPESGSEQVVVTVDFDSAPAGQSMRRLLVTSNDPDESPYPGGVDVVVTSDSCLVDADCDNSLFCDGPEICNAGTCETGTTVDCDDGLFCNGSESCNEATDNCDAGTPPACSDGAFCNGTESCNEATDSCGAGTPPACDDGVFCNGTESCNEATDSCDAGIPPVCDDGAFCNGSEFCNEATDSCDAGTPPACDDGLFCNGTETCNEATDSCDTGTPVVCNDDVGCTVDSCDEATDSCASIPDDVLCNNGLFCDGAETCDAILDCQSGSDPCAPMACDEGSDICTDAAIFEDGFESGDTSEWFG